MRLGLWCVCPLLLVGACVPAPWPPSSARGEREAGRRPAARLEGARVTVVPSGANFLVPEAWLVRARAGTSNLHLTRASLDSVRDASGEWDREYAAVVNGVLPFDSCAAHVGGEGWGRAGTSFADLQARLYIGAFDPSLVRAAVLTTGRAAAAAYFHPVSVDSGQTGAWARTSLRWEALYFDYGATANVEVYTKSRGQETAVLVLMFSSYPARQREEAALLLDSFRWRE